MDKNQLRIKLQPLVKQCELENIHIENVIIEDVDAIAQYYVDLCIPHLTAENFNYIHDRTFDILLETTDKDTREFIFTFCVTNECEGQHHCCPVTAPELEHAQ